MVQNEIMIVECLGCGEEIHPKRLEILPNTKHCVACSDVGRKRGVTVQRGEGDHSYTDVVIMEEKQFIQYIIKNKSKNGLLVKPNFKILMKTKAHQILAIRVTL
jgi:hypothetical protein